MRVVRLSVLVILAVFVSASVYAQDAIKKNVEKFEKNGVEFSTIQPFQIEETKDLSEESELDIEEGKLLEGKVLYLNQSTAKSLSQGVADFIRLELPLGDESLELKLYQQDIFTSDIRIMSDVEPEGNLPLPKASFYRGVVGNEEHSLVALTFFEDEISGLVSYDNQTFVLGKLGDSKTGAHIWYEDDALLLDETFTCEAIDSDDHDTDYKETSLGTQKTAQCVRMRIEIDDDLVVDFGGTSGATNYISSLFNQIVALFANDDIDIAVSEIFAWTNSPYSGSLGNRLGQMSNTSPNADLTQLVTGTDGGGIAYLSGLCSSTFGVSVSGIFGFFFNIPSYSWDVNVCAHEIGHNLSSPHTHACSWNNNNTAIDGCGFQAGFSEGCNASIPSNGGTIMSYCHLLSTGVNFNLGFGPQPTTRMTNYINSRSCLEATCSTEPPVTCEQETLILTINTDQYPGETTWELTEGNTTLASGGPYTSQFTTFVETLCVPVGCYDFTIDDSFGDGICCGFGNGSYTLEDAEGNILVSGGEFNSSETTAFCIDAPAGPCDFLNFNNLTLNSYLPPRDEGTFTIQSGGTEILLEDNSLKLVDVNYDVTANTRLAFEFKSTDQGSAHAIGFDNNAGLSLERLFKLYGTFNSPEAINNFDYYFGSNWLTYVIEVGDYYTGNGLDLVILSVNVNGSPGNNSFFRNVRIYEGNECSASNEVAGSIASTDGDFSIYPNPTTGIVEFNSKDSYVSTLRVFSISGQLIEEVTVNGNRTQIDLTGQPVGMYLIEWVDLNGEMHREKLSKMR